MTPITDIGGFLQRQYSDRDQTLPVSGVEPFWFALRVRTAFERVVAAKLSADGLEVFVPWCLWVANYKFGQIRGVFVQISPLCKA
jgi:hypothetical protein